MAAKIIKWPDKRTALQDAKEFDDAVGFDAVMIIGLIKDSPEELYFGTTDGLTDPEIVYILERTKMEKLFGFEVE